MMLAWTAVAQTPRQVSASAPAATQVPSTPPDVNVRSETQAVDMTPYSVKVARQINFTWYRLLRDTEESPRPESGTATIEFTITRIGKLKDTRIANSSGDIILDRLAVKAVKNSAPFPALPREYEDPDVTLTFHFVLRH